MIPYHFKGQDRVLEAPNGYDHEKNGECIGLPVKFMRDGNGRVVGVGSAWKPTEGQLAILNAGGAVHPVLLGPQVPMYLDVLEASDLEVPA